MKIEYTLIPEMTLEQFADEHGLVMEIGERSNPNLPRYYASFKYAWVLDDIFQEHISGNGRTPEEAISDYTKKIELRRIKIDYVDSSLPKKYIDVPRWIK